MNAAPERMLDDILEGRAIPVDPEMSQLVATASLLQGTLRPAVPPMGQARALFAGGVAARRTRPTWRQLTVPAMAMLALVIAGGSIASRAVPGDALYPVRKVLGAVGLAAPSTVAIDRHIVAAAELIEGAEDDLSSGEPMKAVAKAGRSLDELVSASELLSTLFEEQRAVREVAITSLEQRAAAILDASDNNHSSTPGAGGDDRSGSDEDGRTSDEGEDEGSDADEGPAPDDDDGVGNEGSDRDDIDDRSGSDDSGSGSADDSDTDERSDVEESDTHEPGDDKDDMIAPEEIDGLNEEGSD